MGRSDEVINIPIGVDDSVLSFSFQLQSSDIRVHWRSSNRSVLSAEQIAGWTVLCKLPARQAAQ